jgi:diaminopimelate epimerase
VRATAAAPADGGQVTIAGNATFLYDATIEVDPASGRVGTPLVHARREAEAAACAAAVSALA